jgi:hypothetical protein
MASQPAQAIQENVRRKPKDERPIDKLESLTVSTTGSSASAAFARSLFLFLGRLTVYDEKRVHKADRVGLMFSRPSKLFRPSRG